MNLLPRLDRAHNSRVIRASCNILNVCLWTPRMEPSILAIDSWHRLHVNTVTTRQLLHRDHHDPAFRARPLPVKQLISVHNKRPTELTRNEIINMNGHHHQIDERRHCDYSHCIRLALRWATASVFHGGCMPMPQATNLSIRFRDPFCTALISVAADMRMSE